MGEEGLSETAGGSKPKFPLVESAVIGGLGLVALVVWFFMKDAPKPNVILISIDTLRPDHLGCYGYEPPTSPRMDRFAAEGVRFAKTHSSSSWTLPAHMSLLTGQPDRVHGVVHDTLARDPNVKMLAEAFRENGYRTGGYYGGPYLEPFFGFGEGFEDYVNCGVELFGSVQRVPAAMRNQWLANKERESHSVVTAPKTTDHALSFLERHQEEPFFLFVHHWDVHYDFNAPAEFVRRFWNGPPPDDFSIELFMGNEAIAPTMTAQERAWLIANFDAEIAWVDHHVGRLLDRLDELGLADDTYVVVTADHGEEFFEHGAKGHRQNLYDTTLRIPLLVRGPGIRKGVVVDEQARLFDVMPTILDLCGLPAERGCGGVSLTPLIDGDAPAHLRDLPLLAELTDVPKVRGEDGKVATPHKIVHRACGSNGFKHILAERRLFDSAKPDLTPFGGELVDRSERLFDLDEDPGETQDLSESDPQALERLREKCGKIGGTMQKLKDSLGLIATDREVPAEIREALDAMGYTGNSTTGDDGG